ncbi:hypothetical protein [Parasphingopyxis marina]|uniref:EthD domain-containing protein n=1 Tax=Parasphingopyxis marina TaxID=2761622 RepID=A0A842HXY6_9SPHN|nr:hypothetical protein [Parasphingopyxis marina]MBC2777189.1 hypothetical protein [Parasphingopyxis marina]
MKRQHIFLALSRPRSGREDEFHQWYDSHHLQDVVDLCPGFERGFRAWATDDRPVGDLLQWPSLAIYELRENDVAAIHRDVTRNAKDFTPSNGVFEDDHVAWVYSPVDGDAPAPDIFGDATRNRDGTHTLLAFGNDLPNKRSIVHDGIDLNVDLLEANADQRGGITLPWRQLAKVSFRDADPEAVAGAFGAQFFPEAMRIYRQIGPIALGGSADTPSERNAE